MKDFILSLFSNTVKKIIHVFLFMFFVFNILGVNGQELKSEMSAHFSNSPSWWQTLICFPDDPFKTLVGREGELLYDFGGPYYKSVTGGFKTTIGFQIGNSTKWVNQKLDNPIVPVVVTRYSGDDFEITQESFALKEKNSFISSGNDDQIVRLDDGDYDNLSGKNLYAPAWAKSAAVNRKGSIHYQFMPLFGESSLYLKIVKVALAFYSNKSTQEQKSSMIIQIEGSETKTVNPPHDFGKEKPAVYLFDGKDTNRDGRIDIRVSPGVNNNSGVFLNAFWAFPGEYQISKDDLISGISPSGNYIMELMDGQPSGKLISRDDIILVTLKNIAAVDKYISPEIIVKSTQDVKFNLDNNEIHINENRMISTLGMKSVREIIPQKWLVKLEPVKIEAGKSKSFALVCQVGSKKSIRNYTIEEILTDRKQLDDYWINHSGIPFGKIQVPDSTIQSLINSSIRNIWQARDIKRGVPVFQVGPTFYRGLWIVDGAFLLETAVLLGAKDEARNSIQYTLSQQKNNGSFQILSPKFFKENGIVIWTTVHHALMTQDKKWLELNWKCIEGAFNYILKLREEASIDPSVPWYGINVPGEIDGGLSGLETGFKYGEYSSAYWNLTGMKAAIHAAQWLGKEKQASEWQRDFDSFHNRVMEIMKRDIRKDGEGNCYVPIFMENATRVAPQKGQWSFCQAVYPGQLFAKDDPLLEGMLAMFQNTEQESMVIGTGWLNDGIWNYFASFYGHTWLWQGNGEKAAQCLYAMANHASPTLIWREEHNTNDNAYSYFGDMPHNWASAEFIRLTTHLLAIDRGDELHLMEGFPHQWSKPGMKTMLNEIATPFGNLNMKVIINQSGDKATIQVKRFANSQLKKVVVHLSSLTGKDTTMEFDGKKDINEVINISYESEDTK
jgi:hypothetical protein